LISSYLLPIWAIVNLGIIEFATSLFFCVGNILNGQTWSLRIIGIIMQNVDLQQRLVPIIDWGHNHEGPKLINPHIQHKFEVRILN
jgi:hypothetical protein